LVLKDFVRVVSEIYKRVLKVKIYAQIGGFDKGPDQIIPKPPAPGENLEIKFSSPWEQFGKGLKKQ